jgi:nucleoside-diphosphate-sugar epimerase
MKEKVLVTGGAGYVGSVLVPKILNHGLEAVVFDLMLFGDQGISQLRDRCKIVRGDIRDLKLVKDCVRGVDYVIHLAAIANDPCSNLNPELTKEVNCEATKNLARIAKESGVKRFVYASSSSVYGIRQEPNVTEDLELAPLTIYSQTKAWAEEKLKQQNSPDFTTVSIRSATVCGYSPRQRLDLIVNILASDAITKGIITVNGGEQKRPNVHIEDITDLYLGILNAPAERISGQVFNYGRENHTVNEIAQMVKQVIGDHVQIKMNPKTADSRSYHISSEKIERVLGVYPVRSVMDAVLDIKTAFDSGLIPDPANANYRNIDKMKQMNI